MKTFTGILICFLFLCSMTSRTQNAPVTIGGIVLDHGPNVTVSISVTNFVDIGAISLTMDYDKDIVQVTGITPHVDLPDFTADWITQPGRIIFGWFGSSGVTLPDYSVMVDIHFTGLVAGDTPLTWVDDGISCEYSKYNNGAFTPLNDIPTGDYYMDGHITYQRSGPITVAPVFTSAPGQDFCIPITVYQFTDIGTISLTLDYNPAVLTFQNIYTTSLPSTWTLTGEAVNPGRLIVGGYGPGIASLADGTVLFYACFHYNICGTSTLKWYDADVISCEYSDALTGNPLFDTPTSLFYLDGRVTNGTDAPVTTCGSISDCNSITTVPVEVTNFKDIGAISLTLDYNFGQVQVTGVQPNVNLSGFSADWTSNPGQLVLGWYGNSGVTLPDHSVLFEITFTGLGVGDATDLVWVDNGTSCEYAKYDCGEYNVLNDNPKSSYYIDGHLAYLKPGPTTVAPLYTSVPNNDICIPIKVYQFTAIGAISLTLDYDPSVLTFSNIDPVSIPGTWSFTGQALVPGRLIVGGLGSGFSLNDGDVLFNACFHYNSGTTTLKWWDGNGIACEYADAATLTPLCDKPQSAFYFDGLVTETLTSDFIADNLTPPRNTIVNFTDLSTGNPTSWDWSFDRPPANVVYVGGTDSHSQNPKVKFMVGGPYTVTLTVHNAYLTDSEVKVAYIWAGIHGLWTGETSTDWYTTSNWDDWRVPTNLTDVLIPPAPVPFWPDYIGDFTIGTQCKTITLSDITSQMTVTGDIIRP